MLKKINANEIEKNMNKEYSIVNVHATWCGPCKMMGPIVEEMGKKYDDKFDILRIDIDKNRDFADAKNIQSVPTTFIYKGQKLIDTIIGFASEEMLTQKIK